MSDKTDLGVRNFALWTLRIIVMKKILNFFISFPFANLE